MSKDYVRKPGGLLVSPDGAAKAWVEKNGSYWDTWVSWQGWEEVISSKWEKWEAEVEAEVWMTT